MLKVLRDFDGPPVNPRVAAAPGLVRERLREIIRQRKDNVALAKIGEQVVQLAADVFQGFEISAGARLKGHTFQPDYSGKMYQPLDDSQAVDANQLVKKFGARTIERLMIVVLTAFERIDQRRVRERDFVPDDKTMEFIRSGVFVLEIYNAKPEQFCKGGREIVEQIRALIAEYEGRKSIGKK